MASPELPDDYNTHHTHLEATALLRQPAPFLAERYRFLIFGWSLRFYGGQADGVDRALEEVQDFCIHFFLDYLGPDLIDEVPRPAAPLVDLADGPLYPRYRSYTIRPRTERGSFRGYMEQALKRYRIDRHHERNAQTRGGDWRRIEIDADVARFERFIRSRNLEGVDLAMFAEGMADCLEVIDLARARAGHAPQRSPWCELWPSLLEGDEPDLDAVAETMQATVDQIELAWNRLKTCRPNTPLKSLLWQLVATGGTPRLDRLPLRPKPTQAQFDVAWRKIHADYALGAFLGRGTPDYDAVMLATKEKGDSGRSYLRGRFNALQDEVRDDFRRLIRANNPELTEAELQDHARIALKLIEEYFSD